jgi:hypothetical protein
MTPEVKAHIENLKNYLESLSVSLSSEYKNLQENSQKIGTNQLLSAHSVYLKFKQTVDALVPIIDGCEEETRVELAVRKFLVPNPNKTENTTRINTQVLEKFLSRFTEDERKDILNSVREASISSELGGST